MTVEEIRKSIEESNWYHSFEVLPGFLTPGRHFTDAAKIFNERFHLPEDLRGCKALDIGALDGPYTFELERRGADVVAVDIQDPDLTGFNVAKSLRQSKAQYIQGSVYEISRLISDRFDIITYFGVWYHLKHPLLAFDQIARVITGDGLLLVEGECIRSYTQPGSEHDKASDLALAMADSDIPITLFYAGPYKEDQWSWFVPNRACVQEWLRASGFQLTDYGFWDDFPHQRMFGTAKRNLDFELEVDNPVW